MTYDIRGRAISLSIPGNTTAPARTVTHDHAVGGDPRVVSTSDAAGTITATTDILGRGISYSDVFGNTTTNTYDTLTGRLTSSTSPTGVHGFGYDRGGRLTSQTLDGATIATPTYATPSATHPHSLIEVTYPSGAGTAGNGTKGTLGRNSNGQLTSLLWATTGGTTITSDGVTRSQTGRVVDRSIDGVDARPAGSNFVYDAAGRLSQAWAGTNSYAYNFAASGGCGATTTAGMNTNRTSVTINGTTAATFCYDEADRLTSVNSTTAPFSAYTGSITYDTRGNTYRTRRATTHLRRR